ncbi:hypothetical protein [Halosegnis sp.]|uniref:hypothetical protein n=1 Tax=Halosegnis sp. TaxID=2864959 RepID=UPI0035D3F8CD
MRDVSVQPVEALVAISVGGLCLLVAAVGGLALWAEYVDTWRSFFVLEQTLAMAAPATTVVAALVVVVGAVVVLRSG